MNSFGLAQMVESHSVAHTIISPFPTFVIVKRLIYVWLQLCEGEEVVILPSFDQVKYWWDQKNEGKRNRKRKRKRKRKRSVIKGKKNATKHDKAQNPSLAPPLLLSLNLGLVGEGWAKGVTLTPPCFFSH